RVAITLLSSILLLFFFNAPSTSYLYTLSLHDALPIFSAACTYNIQEFGVFCNDNSHIKKPPVSRRFDLHLSHLERTVSHVSLPRSEEHTSELQSLAYLVCRLLLEKKKTHSTHTHPSHA